jgi:hypothetical protein
MKSKIPAKLLDPHPHGWNDLTKVNEQEMQLNARTLGSARSTDTDTLSVICDAKRQRYGLSPVKACFGIAGSFEKLLWFKLWNNSTTRLNETNSSIFISQNGWLRVVFAHVRWAAEGDTVTLSHNKHDHINISGDENGKLLCKTLYRNFLKWPSEIGASLRIICHPPPDRPPEAPLYLCPGGTLKIGIKSAIIWASNPLFRTNLSHVTDVTSLNAWLVSKKKSLERIPFSFTITYSK